MVDITHKSNSLRIAIAQATVSVSKKETIDAIVNKQVPKGDVFEMAKTAGLFAAKRTSDMIPDCHPLPVEFTSVAYEINGLEINVLVEVRTIYKTGVEVEAMHAASVVALTMYDMLKPIDKSIVIKNIMLLEKKGGKTDKLYEQRSNLQAVVITCSEVVMSGKKEDTAGKAILEKLKKHEINIADYVIISDDKDVIQEKVKKYCNNKIDILIITGGTGLTNRDITPEAIRPMLDIEIEGIAEAMRSYGQNRIAYAMFSRSVAGMIGKTLVLALPGSTRGAVESMDAIFPAVLHIFR